MGFTPGSPTREGPGSSSHRESTTTIIQQLVMLILVAGAHAQCTGFSATCSSCSAVEMCFAAGVAATEVACGDDQLCGEVSGGIASCLASDATEVSSCKCPTNSGYHVDPYDANQYFFCLPDGTQTAASCDDGKEFDTTINSCETP